MREKAKMTTEIWTNLEYNLANIIIEKALSNDNFTTREPLGKIIYHYATLQNFLAIIQTQSLFCTNLNYLNDKKEYNFGVEQVLRVIDKLKSENFANSILENFDDDVDKFIKFFVLNL